MPAEIMPTQDWEEIFLLWSEEKILKKLLLLKDEMGMSGIWQIRVPLTAEAGEGESEIRYPVTPLYIAAGRDYKNLALQLIAWGMPIDAGSTCEASLFYHYISPLDIALFLDHREMVTLLIRHGANLLHQDGRGDSILAYATEESLFILLLEEARKKNCLKELLMLRNKNDNNICDYLYDTKQFERLKILLEIGGREKILDILNFLSQFRVDYWDNPKDASVLNELCMIVRKFFPTGKSLDYKKDYQCYRFEEASFFLFGPTKQAKKKTSNRKKKSFLAKLFEPSHAISKTRDDVLMIAIAEFLSFLNYPPVCWKALRKLEKLLIQYMKVSDRKIYPDEQFCELKKVHDIVYPLPKKEFLENRKKQEKLLEEVLVVVFRRFGFSQKTYEIFGLLPEDVFKELILTGAFFRESGLGGGILHGTIAHMLQLFLLIYFFSKKMLGGSYHIQERIFSLTARDVWEAMVFKKIKGTQTAVWSVVQDGLRTDCISFSNPEQLSSLLMAHGAILRLPILSKIMRYNFCVEMAKWQRFFSTIPAYADMTMSDFFDSMNDTQSGFFYTPSPLLRFSLQRKKEKGTLCLGSVEAGYGIAEKNYKPDPRFNFSPRQWLK